MAVVFDQIVGSIEDSESRSMPGETNGASQNDTSMDGQEQLRRHLRRAEQRKARLRAT